MGTRGSRAAVSLLFLASSLLIACSGDPAVEKQKHLARGDVFAAAGKLPEAILEYRNAVQADARAGDARVKLAEAYVRAGDGAKALTEYVRAADLLPEDVDVHIKAGSLQLLAGRFDEAKRLADGVLAQDPSSVDGQILLANALAGLKDFNAAVEEIEEAIRLDPERGASYTSLGAFEIQRGHAEAAEHAFKKAIELDGKSVPARLALANFYWTTARWEPAERELLKAADLEQANAIVHRALANFYLTTNRALEAEQHLKKALEITKDPLAALALADYYTARSNPTSAREVLQPLAETGPTASFAESKLAMLDFQAGARDEGHKRLDRVLARDNTNLPALLSRTSALLEEGKLQDAASSAATAVEHHKDSAEALFALARVQMARRDNEAAIATLNEVLQKNPRATAAKVALARLHLAAGRADTSVGLAQEAVALEPRNLEARLTVVRGLLARKELSRAESELALLLKGAPASPSVHALSGVLSGLKGNQGAARAQFERALELDPRSLEGLRGLVLLDLAAKRPAEARARVDARLAADRRNPAVLMFAAQTYASTGDLQAAERLLRDALAVDSSYLDAYSALAQIYVKQNRLEAALAEFDELATRQPRPVAALTFAGMILQGQGKHDQARDRFTRALDLDPDAAVAANNLAWLYAASGDRLEAALELAQRAKARLPNAHEVDDTLGYVHLQRNSAAQAIPFFESSVKAAPDNPIYHYHLGLAYAKASDNQRARRHLTRALELKADFEGANEARATLRTLQAS